MSSLLLVFVPALALADAPKDVFVVLGTGEAVSEELAEDVTEALAFSIAQEKGLSFLPRELLLSKLQYTDPTSPGTCLFDNECLRRVHETLGTRWFVLARLARRGDDYKVTVIRIGDSAATDSIKAASVPGGAADVINKTRGMVVASLRKSVTTFVVTVNEPDAVVVFNGKEVGKGSTTVKVKPGAYRIVVRKEGFTSFDAKLECAAERQCIVPVNILPKRTLPIDPVPGDLSGTLVVTGWSVAGVGVAMTAMGIAFGLQAADAQSRLDGACPTPGEVCSLANSVAEDLHAEGETGSLLFNTVGIGGMILAAAGLVTAIAGHAMTPAPSEKVDVTPTLGPNGTVMLNARIDF